MKDIIDDIDPVKKTYKGLPLEDAEIHEVEELVIEKYREFQNKLQK